MSEDRPHHPRSPSKLQYLEACPCFRSKEDVIHKRAIAGTRAHASVESQEDDAKLEDRDALAVAECLDFVAQRRAFMQQQADDAFAHMLAIRNPALPRPEPWPIKEVKEAYLPIDDCKYDDAESTTAGYIDHGFVSWDETYAELIDYKFGFWEVERADNNLQGFAYTLGLFRRFPKLQTVRFWFKQPHLDYLTDAVFRREDISTMYLRVKLVVDRAVEANKRGDFSYASPQTPVCLFCDNLGLCPAVAKLALRVAHKFHPLGVPESVTPSVMQDPQNTRLAMELAGVLKVWVDAFKRQVANRVLRGDAPVPPGYKIQQMPGRRAIQDMMKFKEVCLRYMEPEQYLSCLEASFGNVEDKVNERAPRGAKETTVKQFQKDLEDSGAVAKGDSYCFLRQCGEKPNKDNAAN